MSEVKHYRRGLLQIDADTGDAYLPHSCGNWRIGGPHEAEQLLDDLEAFARGEYEPKSEFSDEFKDLWL